MADANPVSIVATVEEYFFKIVSANLKKNADRIPCAALIATSSIVTVLWPAKIDTCDRVSFSNLVLHADCYKGIVPLVEELTPI